MNSIVMERKRLDKLDKLKKLGGPFTDADEVMVYVGDPEITEKEKKVRMKMELQFARDSSTTLPKADPLFRVACSLIRSPSTTVCSITVLTCWEVSRVQIYVHV